MNDPLPSDREHILASTRGLWEDLRGKRIFITGGTGFYGGWLLESFLAADREHGLGSTIIVLTRDPAAFRARRPHLAADPAVVLHEGDIRAFDFPKGSFSHVIHAAVEPGSQAEAVVQGCRRALDFARACGAERFLLASSGAVYGKEPAGAAGFTEDHRGSSLSPYGEGKLSAEALCAEYAADGNLKTLVARGFAFCGPYLPLDGAFAVGNFIRDAAKGGPIRVLGDGTAVRSYLYGADLAVWLWTILLRGQSGRPYNVGSQKAVSVAELARTVASVLGPGLEVVLEKQAAPGMGAPRYLPSTDRARSELGLRETVDLADSIGRTSAWAAGVRALHGA